MITAGALCSAVALAIPHRARAEEEPGGAPAALQRADELLRLGVELRRQGNEKEALDKFREAYQLSPTPRARGQMGLASKSLRMYVEAEQYLNEALAAKDDTWVAQNRATLESALAFVNDSLGWLDVVTDTADAQLFVEGFPPTQLPLARPLRVVARDVRVEVRAVGHRSYSAIHTLIARRMITVRVHLEPEMPPAPPIERTVAAGSHTSGQRTAAYVVAAAGGIGLGAGTYFGIRALTLRSERNDICPEAACPTKRGVELDEDARGAATYSTVAFALGAGAIGAAAYLFFTAPATSSSSSTKSGAGREAGRFRIGIAPVVTSGAYATVAWDL